jgi:hypothetical protein
MNMESDSTVESLLVISYILGSVCHCTTNVNLKLIPAINQKKRSRWPSFSKNQNIKNIDAQG